MTISRKICRPLAVLIAIGLSFALTAQAQNADTSQDLGKYPAASHRLLLDVPKADRQEFTDRSNRTDLALETPTVEKKTLVALGNDLHDNRGRSTLAVAPTYEKSVSVATTAVASLTGTSAPLPSSRSIEKTAASQPIDDAPPRQKEGTFDPLAFTLLTSVLAGFLLFHRLQSMLFLKR